MEHQDQMLIAEVVRSKFKTIMVASSYISYVKGVLGKIQTKNNTKMIKNITNHSSVLNKKNIAW